LALLPWVREFGLESVPRGTVCSEQQKPGASREITTVQQQAQLKGRGTNVCQVPTWSQHWDKQFEISKFILILLRNFVICPIIKMSPLMLRGVK
jgi:hypothetical protein